MNHVVNLKNKFIFFVSIVFYSCCFTISSFDIPSLTGFTTVQECSENNFPVEFLLDDTVTNQFVLCLPYGMVVNEGGIVTCKGKVLQDTETYKQDQHRLLRGNIPSKKIFFDGKLAVISSPGQENWYHWLLQVLPRLKILAESTHEFDKIYVDNVRYGWQKESLKAVLTRLNIPESKLFLVEGDVMVQANMLVVPSVPFIPAKNRKLLPAWLKHFLRDTFLTNKTPSVLPKKVYVSRSKARHRRIMNEDKLIALLEKRGFVVLHLEDMSVFDQAHIFNNAQLIIGPHGSGFANLIFSQPGTTIIEIDHGLEGEQRSFYKRFTSLMSGTYIPFYTDQVGEENLEEDILVNLASFENLVSKMV